MFAAENRPQKLVQLQWVQDHVAVDAWHHERLHLFANERHVALVTAGDQVLHDPYLQLGWQGEEVCGDLGWIFDLAARCKGLAAGCWYLATGRKGLAAGWSGGCHHVEIVAVTK